MGKRQRARKSPIHASAVTAQPTASPTASPVTPAPASQQTTAGQRPPANQQPMVSLCTVTYNRSGFLPLLQRHILAQTYPRDRMEWVLVDDSDDGKPDFQPDHSQGLAIIHRRLDNHLPLGAKRNLSHSLCRGDIIVYLDDDDFYPPTRVAHAVERLLASDVLMAGSTILPILFLPERELWIAGPYGDNHATAGTFAFKRQLLEQTSYDAEKTYAEEKSFLKDYSIPMVQLDPGHTILCIAHDRNTYEKRNLLAGGTNPRFRQGDPPSTERLLEQLKHLLPSYESLLNPNREQRTPKPTEPRVEIIPQQARVSVRGQLLNQRGPSPGPTAHVQGDAASGQEIEEVNICIISHPGDIFSLCFLDVARYLRYRLHLMAGIKKVRLSKNRLCHDAINLVLGAHVGFDANICKHYRCIIVNLEQLGQSGKNVRPAYTELLKNAAVIDYDTSNLAYYGKSDSNDAAIISFGYAPYLQASITATPQAKPLKEREIDLLFYGSMNESRLQVLQQLANHGPEIRVLNNLFGPERDAVIQNSKLVLNLSYYDKGTFEQVRAFHCLSLGTPILSILSDSTTNIPPQFSDSVFFMNPDQACSFLVSQFKTDAFYAEAQSKLMAYKNHPLATLTTEQDQLRRLLESVDARQQPVHRQRLRKIRLGDGSRYLQGWINIDRDTAARPDLVLDLGQELPLPLLTHSRYLGPISISENSMEHIYIDHALEQASNLPQLMNNCLRMLKVGGLLEIITPHDSSPASRHDPSQIRALHARSWSDYTEASWRLGWFKERFKLQSLSHLHANGQEVANGSGEALFTRVLLIKETTDLNARNQYRLERADFGPDLDDFGDDSESG